MLWLVAHMGRADTSIHSNKGTPEQTKCLSYLLCKDSVFKLLFF